MTISQTNRIAVKEINVTIARIRLSEALYWETPEHHASAKSMMHAFKDCRVCRRISELEREIKEGDGEILNELLESMSIEKMGVE